MRPLQILPYLATEMVLTFGSFSAPAERSSERALSISWLMVVGLQDDYTTNDTINDNACHVLDDGGNWAGTGGGVFVKVVENVSDDEGDDWGDADGEEGSDCDAEGEEVVVKPERGDCAGGEGEN